MLDPDAVFRLDLGPGHPRARPPVVGADAVAREVLAEGAPFAPLGRPGLVNGAIGVIVGPPERPIAVAGCTVAGGRLVELNVIVDPRKLARIR